ncbi:death-on-curing protein [Microvirga ossetica]|uniref:Death-on-curing protein n=1 Tax=Microvirga ossetica TaxID=1882682 RepID=A0A1B2EJJ0_9HYPH|nr:type II toxin-antitoxin system death-on-curing family toxin [Microvirga ossetica]ANY80107.1 death-on-curing protein [Microvirga ossetica]
MTEPRWISRQALLLKHAESLRLFGGADGLRDEGMLDSARARPVNAWSYRGEAGIAQLAAAYAFGLSKNHPFIDGNKRAAFIACVGFLKLNGLNLVASQLEAYRTMIDLAAGAMSEEEFAAWIQANIEARPAL